VNTKQYKQARDLALKGFMRHLRSRDLLPERRVRRVAYWAFLSGFVDGATYTAAKLEERGCFDACQSVR